MVYLSVQSSSEAQDSGQRWGFPKELVYVRVGLHHQTGSTDAEPPEAEYDPGSVGRKSFTIQEPRCVDVKLGESSKWARVMSAVVGKFRDIAGSI